MTESTPADTAIFLSTAQAATRLGLCETNIRKMAREGILDGRKAGARLLISAASIRAFAASLPRVGKEG